MKQPSIINIALSKYTSFAEDIKVAKSIFSEGLSTTELNKLYSGAADKNSTVKQPVFSQPGDENPNSSPVGKVASEIGNTDSDTATELDTLDGISDTKPITLPNGDEVLINPITGEITVSSNDPNKVVIRSKQDMTKLQGLANSAKSILDKPSVVTNEDIMSALTTLSTGDVVLLEPEKDSTIKVVNNSDDVLIPNEKTNEDGTPQPEISTASELMEPTDGTSTKTSKSTGKPGSASAYMPIKTEIKDMLTGVDSSYTVEDDSDNTKSDEKKDPDDLDELSGKESSFWVPDDDLLGLSDIVKTVSAANGVPDAQTNIVKTSDGTLVKKPTTPAYNIKQYVKTTNPPISRQFGNIGSGSATTSNLDISDLDKVLGMDSESDRALNISLSLKF